MNSDIVNLIEALIKVGGKKFKDGVKFIKPYLLIKHKKAGVKYTVAKVVLEDPEQPYVICYRYYNTKKKNKKIYIKISKSNFRDYEAV